MQENKDSTTAQNCGCCEESDERAPEYVVEKRGGVLNITVTSGVHKGQTSVFFETPPSLAYFNAKK